MKSYKFTSVTYTQNWSHFAEDWQNLFLRAQSDPSSLPPFYHPIFLNAAQHLPKSDQPTHIILGYKGGNLVFGLPIKKHQPLSGFSTVMIWGGPGFDYLAPLDITGNFEASEFFFKHGLQDLNFQLITGEHLSTSFVSTGNALKGAWTKLVFRCPYLQLPDNENDLLNGFDRHFRHNIRGSLKKAETNNIKFRVNTSFTGTHVLIKALEELFTLHRKRSISVGRESNFADETTEDFYLAISSLAQDCPGIVHFFELMDGNRVIASLFGYLIGNRFLSFQSGFSKEYEQLSPGTIIIYKTMCYLIQEGVTEFDFLRGADDYKFRWTSTWRETMRFAYGPGLLGRMFTQQFRLKRAMKRHGRITGLRLWLRSAD